MVCCCRSCVEARGSNDKSSRQQGGIVDFLVAEFDSSQCRTEGAEVLYIHGFATLHKTLQQNPFIKASTVCDIQELNLCFTLSFPILVGYNFKKI